DSRGRKIRKESRQYGRLRRGCNDISGADVDLEANLHRVESSRYVDAGAVVLVPFADGLGCDRGSVELEAVIHRHRRNLADDDDSLRRVEVADSEEVEITRLTVRFEP